MVNKIDLLFMFGFYRDNKKSIKEFYVFVLIIKNIMYLFIILFLENDIFV